MIRRWLLAAIVLAVSAASAGAQPKLETGTMKKTSPGDAKAMFENYCAACHGLDAKGTGPAAAALKKVPADLTKISARNDGKFPEIKVKRYIEGLDEVAAHGSRDMPMWGRLFKELDRDTAMIRVQALSNYLKGLQQ